MAMRGKRFPQAADPIHRSAGCLAFKSRYGNFSPIRLQMGHFRALLEEKRPRGRVPEGR